MLNLQEIIKITNECCEKQGASLRSRQIRGLAEAITVQVNEQLDFIDKRLKLLEFKYKKSGGENCGLHKVDKHGKRHNGQTRLEAIENEE